MNSSTSPGFLARNVAWSALGLAACAAPGGADDLLQAMVWVQTAAEHDAVCEQVFAAATRAMCARTQEVGARPYAVIVDVDETMLDNSPYQAAMVRDGRGYSSDTWSRWCERGEAAAVPGAVDFAAACRARDVRVFYVTNRDAGLEAATRRNLLAVGLPVEGDGGGLDAVLCRGEVDGAASKEGRRASVAATHTVVLLLGDDLGDFVEASDSVAQRRLQVQRHRDEWGQRWFVLPNPMYGSWERAVVGDRADKSAARRAMLSPTQ